MIASLFTLLLVQQARSDTDSGLNSAGTAADPAAETSPPPVPIKGGCYAWMPSGCPRKDKDYGYQWTRDLATETSHENENECLTTRVEAWNTFCGVSDAVTYYKVESCTGKSGGECNRTVGCKYRGSSQQCLLLDAWDSICSGNDWHEHCKRAPGCKWVGATNICVDDDACLLIKLPGMCKGVPGCGWDKYVEKCMDITEIPCDRYKWPIQCNPIPGCLYDVEQQKCIKDELVDCSAIKFPHYCKPQLGCGYMQEVNKCVKLDTMECEDMHGTACNAFPDRCYYYKKSRACVTIPIIDASKFATGGYLPGDCLDKPKYFAVTDVTSCRAAALAWGKKWYHTVSALYVGVLGVCTLIVNSPNNSDYNDYVYFGTIGTTGNLAQEHHHLICAEFGAVSERCVDFFQGCENLAKEGACHAADPVFKNEIQLTCAKSCGTCPGMTPDPSPVPTAIPTPTPTECEDIGAGCQAVADQNGCHSPDLASRAQIHQSCPHSCGLCEGQTPIPIKCMDVAPGCVNIAREGGCVASDPTTKAEVLKSCPESCGVCPGSTPVPIVCEDKFSFCFMIAGLCFVPGQAEATQGACPVTCDVCPSYDSTRRLAKLSGEEQPPLTLEEIHELLSEKYLTEEMLAEALL